MHLRFLLVLAALLLVTWAPTSDAQDSQPKRPASPEGESGGAPGVADFGVFSFQPPKEWKVVRPPGSVGMRKAEYRIPAKSEGGKDSEFVVYYFGPRSGGSVEANLERWQGQFTKPEEMPEEEFSKITKKTVAGLKVTILEIRGTYQATAMRPGAPAAPARPFTFMIATVIETSAGPYFFRAVGDRASLEPWRTEIFRMIDKMKAKPKE